PRAGAISPASEIPTQGNARMTAARNDRRDQSVKGSRLMTVGAALCGALLTSMFTQAGQAPAPAGAQANPAPQATQRPMVSCQRGGLQHAVRLYLEAQAKG